MRRFTYLIIILFVWMGMAAAPTLQAAPASTITVTNTSNSGSGSLRQAVADAIAGDTIVFASGITGQTITLSSSIAINKNLTIDGTGRNITLAGNGSTRIFDITSGPVTLNGLSFINGTASSDNGGAIHIQDTSVTITSSTFVNNTATYEGGAVRNNGSGTLTVSSSTFHDNNSGSFGGGISNNGGTVLVTNSSFYHNLSSTGGGIFNNGTLDVRSSTFVYNGATSAGAGIRSHYSTTLMLRNTLIAGTLPSPYDSYNCDNLGTLAVNTNNMIEDGSCSPALSGNPLLMPLTDNGGSTQTMIPRLDSPAVNAGNCSSGPATDQRGQTRPQNTTCDIGAVEVQQPSDTVVQHCGLVQGNTYLFRATGVQLTIDTLGDLDCVTAQIFNAVHPNATANILAPYVTLGATTTGGAPYAATMTLLHDNLSNPFVCKYPGGLGGSGWDCAQSGYDSYTVWRSGISSFSDWAIGNNVGPTAVTLQSLSATSTPATTLVVVALFGLLLVSTWVWYRKTM